jgi:2-(1,2-epoxy-1,2-dihydrophenyl)acetyl-CoA isomerase
LNANAAKEEPEMGIQIDRDESVLTITLERPEQLNAFTREQHRELADALERAKDDEIRAVIITGAGRGFCVGQDLDEVRAESGENGGGNDSRLREGYHPNILAIRALEKPVIAAVNGVAAGAGLSLAAACDVRIASRKAKFVPAFVNLGLIPDSGGSYFLPRLIGYARSFEWLTSGRHLDAEEALAWGLVSELVEPDQLNELTRERATQLAGMPGSGIAGTKRLLDQSLQLVLEDELEHEVEMQLQALSTPEYEQAMQEFLERSGG